MEVITSDNLIENIDKIGPWSIYGLASIAIKHYFPNEYDADDYCSTVREAELCTELGCMYWQDVVIKYQTEVGYKCPGGFNPEYVNAY